VKGFQLIEHQQQGPVSHILPGNKDLLLVTDNRTFLRSSAEGFQVIMKNFEFTQIARGWTSTLILDKEE